MHFPWLPFFCPPLHHGPESKNSGPPPDTGQPVASAPTIITRFKAPTTAAFMSKVKCYSSKKKGIQLFRHGTRSMSWFYSGCLCYYHYSPALLEKCPDVTDTSGLRICGMSKHVKNQSRCRDCIGEALS